jgi:hypothetical protein
LATLRLFISFQKRWPQLQDRQSFWLWRFLWLSLPFHLRKVNALSAAATVVGAIVIPDVLTTAKGDTIADLEEAVPRGTAVISRISNAFVIAK